MLVLAQHAIIDVVENSFPLQSTEYHVDGFCWKVMTYMLLIF